MQRKRRRSGRINPAQDASSSHPSHLEFPPRKPKSTGGLPAKLICSPTTRQNRETRNHSTLDPCHHHRHSKHHQTRPRKRHGRTAPAAKTAPPTRSSASLTAAFPSTGKSAKSNPLKKRGTSPAHKDNQPQRRKTGDPNAGRRGIPTPEDGGSQRRKTETLNGKRKRWNRYNRGPRPRTARSADNP